jgi:RNA polymerase sigma-70 factor (ECF subfamily)
MGKWLDSAARKEAMGRMISEQNGRCCYCGKVLRLDVRARHPDRATIEHRIPLAAGGSSRSTNIAAACRNCNSRKSTRSEEEFQCSLALRNEIQAEINSIMSGGHAVDPMPAEELQGWQDILQQLPQRTFAVVLLSRVEGLSHVQIASRLGIPAWTVRRHMLKAIRHIANARCDRCEEEGRVCWHERGRGTGQRNPRK